MLSLSSHGLQHDILIMHYYALHVSTAMSYITLQVTQTFSEILKTSFLAQLNLLGFSGLRAPTLSPNHIYIYAAENQRERTFDNAFFSRLSTVRRCLRSVPGGSASPSMERPARMRVDTMCLLNLVTWDAGGVHVW
jgi:hypothetical protein